MNYSRASDRGGDSVFGLSSLQRALLRFSEGISLNFPPKRGGGGRLQLRGEMLLARLGRRVADARDGFAKKVLYVRVGRQKMLVHGKKYEKQCTGIIS